MDSHKFTTVALYCNYLAATWLVTLRTFAPHHISLRVRISCPHSNLCTIRNQIARRSRQCAIANRTPRRFCILSALCVCVCVSWPTAQAH